MLLARPWVLIYLLQMMCIKYDFGIRLCISMLFFNHIYIYFIYSPVIQLAPRHEGFIRLSFIFSSISHVFYLLDKKKWHFLPHPYRFWYLWKSSRVCRKQHQNRDALKDSTVFINLIWDHLSGSRLWNDRREVVLWCVYIF